MAHAEEIASLLRLADWYRAWAELAESVAEKADRLAMAVSAEEQARKLAEQGG